MKKAIFPVLTAMCVLLVAGAILCGCEKSSAIGFLSVTPAMVMLEGMHVKRQDARRSSAARDPRRPTT